MTIDENIQRVRERVARAAERAGRDPQLVKVVGAVKGMPSEVLTKALAAGLLDLGENFVQEAEAHRSALGENEARWHCIGHLQTNKARDATRLFDTIHSVDSLRLAEQLSRRAPAKLAVFLEVNVSGEASKYGVQPAGVSGLAAAAGRLPNLELVGLMTMAPAVADPEAVRPVFRTLRELAVANGLTELSMGMTDDFEVAVEEGATLVRIGRAIFGERPI
jgi:pyridoxal phosphate enzyme (YggS family)